MTRCVNALLAIAPLMLLPLDCATVRAEERSFVEKGRAQSVYYEGEVWAQKDDCIEGGGEGQVAYATLALGPGDATVQARLRIDDLWNSAASFFVSDSHFGFQGGSGTMFVEGPLFGGALRFIGSPVVSEGKAFDFEARRRGSRLSLRIDGRRVYETEVHGTLGKFGFRPHRGTIGIYEWRSEGSLVDSVKEPRRMEERRPDFFVDVFESGPSRIPNYRIPALITTKKGTLLAFCEGRRDGEGDSGNIDLILKRSTDGGESWGAEEVVWDDAGNTCGNPCPVVDQTTGRIWLPMTWNPGGGHETNILLEPSQEGKGRRVFITHSDDDGRTWAPPKEISASVDRPHWRWYATGPGNSIQLTRGKHAGRIVVPANHSDHTPSGERDMTLESNFYRSHVFYSDDHGETWKLGGVLDRATNESTIVELEDGSILDNMRSYAGKHRRAVAVSGDGGDTWSPVTHHPELVEPRCQASMLRYSFQSGTEKGRILFANPAAGGARVRMTVRMSYDEGETWRVAAMIYSGSAAYSCMTILPDGSVGIFFERDGTTKLTFAKFTMDWLEKGGD